MEQKLNFNHNALTIEQLLQSRSNCSIVRAIGKFVHTAQWDVRQPLGKEPFRRWEPFGIHNSSGFPNRIPAISLKNVQVGAVPSSTVYLQPL